MNTWKLGKLKRANITRTDQLISDADYAWLFLDILVADSRKTLDPMDWNVPNQSVRCSAAIIATENFQKRR